MPGIVVVGSLNMDLVVKTPRTPDAGETVLGTEFHTIPGGKGANQAVASARQGADVTMIGRVGNDSFGWSLLSSLRNDGVGIDYIRVSRHLPTGVALITVDEKGENRIIVVPGANGGMTAEDVEAAMEPLARADVLIMQLEIPLDAVERATALAKSRGITTILNAAPARELPADLLCAMDYLVVNETEAGILAQGSPDQPEEVARELYAKCRSDIIVTLGERGTLVLHDGQLTSVPAFPVTPVDTTAAGDAFVAAFAGEIARGQPAVEAARWGNAAGALATTVLGAQPSLPTYDAVRSFLTVEHRQ